MACKFQVFTLLYQLDNKDAKIVTQKCNGIYTQVWAQNVILKLHQKKTLELCIIIFIFILSVSSFI